MKLCKNLRLGKCITIFSLIFFPLLVFLPNFFPHWEWGFQCVVKSNLDSLLKAQDQYYAVNKCYAKSIDQLNSFKPETSVIIKITKADKNCFSAIGRHMKNPNDKYDLTINCNNIKTKNFSSYFNIFILDALRHH